MSFPGARILQNVEMSIAVADLLAAKMWRLQQMTLEVYRKIASGGALF